MTDIGVDYSSGRPNLDQLWNSGYRFVLRYLCYAPNPKQLTKPELDALLAKGFQVHLNWEQWGDWAHDFSGGATTGATHATEAVKQARTLGAPPGTAIYFSVDFNASQSQQPLINAYMAAAKQVVNAAGYRMGGYAGYFVLKRMFDAGVIDVGWQTYAWSGGLWEPRAALRQDNNNISAGGAACDHNTRLGASYPIGGTEEDMKFVRFNDGSIFAITGADPDGRVLISPVKTLPAWNEWVALGYSFIQRGNPDPALYTIAQPTATAPVTVDTSAITAAVESGLHTLTFHAE